MGLHVGHAGPVEGARVHRGVVAGVLKGPGEHQTLVVEAAVGVDFTAEVLAEVVHVVGGPGVDPALRARAVVGATRGEVVDGEHGAVVVKHFPHHRGAVVPGNFCLEGVVAFWLECQHRRGHVVVLGVGHAGPVERTGIHRAVGVVAHNGPRQEHAFVHEVAEGVNGAAEVLTEVVGGLGGPSVSGTGVGRATAGVVATGREVRDHERVRVGTQVFPHHRRGVVPGPVNLEGVVALSLHGQCGGGHVVEFVGLHGGPVEGTGVHGAVVVVSVFNSPVKHHGLVGQGTVGVDGPSEILADVVEVGVGVGIDAGFGSILAAHRGGTAAAAGEVEDHERAVA